VRRLNFSKFLDRDLRRYRSTFVLLVFCVGCASTTANLKRLANLFVGILDRMGVHAETLGDSTGELDSLSGI